MNLRPLALTVAALVVLCAVVWYARRPAAPASADPRVGTPLLAPEVANLATRIRLTEGAKTVELAVTDAGNWIVPTYHDFPADFAKLSRLVSDLTAAKVQRLVTARPDRLERLEFKDTTVTLLGGDQRELWTLSLGKTATGGGRYVRFGTEEKAYLADLSLWLDPEPKSWADAALIDLKSADIAAIEVGFTDPTAKPILATRTGPEAPWTAAAPEGQRLVADRINGVLSNLLNLRFTDTVKTDDAQVAAARDHRRVLRVKTFSGLTWTLAFDRKPEEKRPKPPTAPAAPAGDGANTETPAPAPDQPTPAAPAEPEFETVPAGPVFVTVNNSDPAAPINTRMKQRIYQVGEWSYTGLPATPADFWEPAAPAAPTPEPAPPPAAPKDGERES